MNVFHRNDLPVLVAIALVWFGSIAYGWVYDGTALALVVGGLAIGVAALVAGLAKGGRASQVLLPLLGMAMVALLIHSARGRIEAHFAVFSFLACLVVYRRALPVLVGAGTIALHHLSFNFFQQWGWGPMCFTEPSLGRVIEHAVFVICEAGVLLVLVARARADFAQGEELRHIANGLLTREGHIDFSAAHRPTRSPVARDMQQVLFRIEQTVATMRASAESIQAAASEVGSGSRDLSERSEMTSSELVETAHSVQSLGSAVGATAESAQTATQLAENAAAVAQRGSSMVSQVVSTMDGIQSSSRRIGDIIGVIDGIAFQTNILALNAAVEAARAGAQGRGFAVVASEVRALAQRSASAAREIKDLISTSLGEVEQGSRLVSDAGATMDQLVAAVQQVSDTITSISRAAAEQNMGVGQVNSAIAELESITHRNSSLAQQSAQAGEGLLAQAQKLTEAVEAFRLSGAGAGAPASPR